MASPFHPPRFCFWTNKLPKSQKQKPPEANMGRQSCKQSLKDRQRPTWDAKVANKVENITPEASMGHQSCKTKLTNIGNPNDENKITSCVLFLFCINCKV